MADKMDSVESPGIIISIDFGTTLTKVAYILTETPSEIHILEDWPGVEGQKRAGCPSLLEYRDSQTIKWGFEVDPILCVAANRLLLDPTSQQSIDALKVERIFRNTELDPAPVEVVRDFLGELTEHVLRTIASKHPAGCVRKLVRQFVLSVPASWSEEVRESFLEVARLAGICPATLIKESEAAAIHALKEMPDDGLDVGDTFLICDAGGATVNLMSYDIVKMDPLEIEEVIPASSSNSGSLMINRRFEEYIKLSIGLEQFTATQESGILATTLEMFEESIKPKFPVMDEEECCMKYQDASPDVGTGKGLKNDRLTFTRAILQSIFRPVVMNIRNLVLQQYSDVIMKRFEVPENGSGKAIKTVFLVGGLGSNEYLLEVVKGTGDSDLSIVRCPDASTAVARGAALYGLSTRDFVSSAPKPAPVTSRSTPKCYGLAGRTYEVDEVEDVEQTKEICGHRGKIAVKRMFWFGRGVDGIDRTKIAELEIFRAWSLDAPSEEMQVTENLLEASSDATSRYPGSDSQVKCVLHCDLAAVPKELFEKRARMGEDEEIHRWMELRYSLVLVKSAEYLRFSLRCGGKEYGSVRVEV